MNLNVLRNLESRETGIPRAAFSPYLQLVRNTIAVHPDKANLLGAAGYLVRRFDADASDLVVQAGRLDEALAYARRCHAIDPNHVCCRACALGIRLRQTRKETDFDALRRLYETQPEGSHTGKHAGSVLHATVMATASDVAVLRGTGSKVVRQVLRRSGKWRS
jgi:hypothetical protein